MSTNGWRAVGLLAKQRREQLGLTQEQVADRGGPKVTTVGKFERAAARFPTRTQAQLESALGWKAGVIAMVATSINSADRTIEEWAEELLAAPAPVDDAAHEVEHREAADALAAVLRLIPPPRRPAALAAALAALSAHFDGAAGDIEGE